VLLLLVLLLLHIDFFLLHKLLLPHKGIIYSEILQLDGKCCGYPVAPK
jgi:hypothetical protein